MLPKALIELLQGVKGFDEQAFLAEHLASKPPVSIRINTTKWKAEDADIQVKEKVPWAQDGFYLDHRPVFTLDPWLHAGAYYVQEASSMFMEQAIQKITSCITVQYALDICAAPGGKSTHLLACLPKDCVLVSNEVVSARAAILVENMTKWGSSQSIVTQNDPADFSKFGGMFDLMLVDAPCSCSGLFRRDPNLITEWSPGQVSQCSQRQKRILADALPALAPGGFLIYSTCSYAVEENEAMLDWLVKTFHVKGNDLEWIDNQYGVVVTSSPECHIPCYRFFPGRVEGEGFFMALLQKEGEHRTFVPSVKYKQAEVAIPSGGKAFLKNAESFLFHRHAETIYAMPEEVYKLFHYFQGKMNMRKAGVKTGDWIHGKFNPAHDLALSTLIKSDAFFSIEPDKENVLHFLRRHPFDIPEKLPTGWILLYYKGLPIGFIKNIGNRINNYYPKDWRIRLA